MSNVMLQCLLGMQCNDFVMIAADQINTHSVVVMKDDLQKIFAISDSLLIGVNGDNGDTSQFAQFVAKNLQLYKMRNGYQLDTNAAVHFTRQTLAEGMRSGATSYMLNLLIAGYDEEQGGQLYYLDHMTSSIKVPFAAHGIGGMLGIGVLERFYRPNLTEKEAYEVLEMAIHEIQKRFFVSLPKFQVSVVDKDGTRKLPTICPVKTELEH